MDITFKKITPKTKKDGITININTNMTVGEVKEIYYTIANWRVNNQCLFLGEVLKDSYILLSYEFDNFDKIEAYPSSKGGGGDALGIDMAYIFNEKGLVKKYNEKSKKCIILTKD